MSPQTWLSPAELVVGTVATAVSLVVSAVVVRLVAGDAASGWLGLALIVAGTLLGTVALGALLGLVPPGWVFRTTQRRRARSPHDAC